MRWLGLSLIFGSFIGYALLPSIYVAEPSTAQLLFVLDVSRTSILLSWLVTFFFLGTWMRNYLKRPKLDFGYLGGDYFSAPLGAAITGIMVSVVMTFEHPISALVAAR